MSAAEASRLFWTTDEDGETVHRLQAEWDGNKGPAYQRGDYRSEAEQWELSAGVMWSRWGLGVDVGWTHEATWVGGADGTTVHYRRQDAVLHLGPWYVSWTRCRPLASGTAPEARP
ncbi:MAG: hypothetical protein JWP11_3690 [Frankiales bacterium]|nr:hypothetical protein [Frankiales bacterium]